MCSAEQSGSNAFLENAFRIRAAHRIIVLVTKPQSKTSVRVSCAFLAMSATRKVHALKVNVAKRQTVRPLLSLAPRAAKMLHAHKIQIASPIVVILEFAMTNGKWHAKWLLS